MKRRYHLPTPQLDLVLNMCEPSIITLHASVLFNYYARERWYVTQSGVNACKAQMEKEEDCMSFAPWDTGADW